MENLLKNLANNLYYLLLISSAFILLCCMVFGVARFDLQGNARAYGLWNE